MGLDPNGNLHMRMSDNMSMDMNTGEVHIVDSWKNEAGKEKRDLKNYERMIISKE